MKSMTDRSVGADRRSQIRPNRTEHPGEQAPCFKIPPMSSEGPSEFAADLSASIPMPDGPGLSADAIT